MSEKKGSQAVDELECDLGLQVRQARRAAGHTQAQLADLANVSVGTIRNLEAGTGSRLTTLVRVARVLGRENWLTSFFLEEPPFNPLDLLDEKVAH